MKRELPLKKPDRLAGVEIRSPLESRAERVANFVGCQPARWLPASRDRSATTSALIATVPTPTSHFWESAVPASRPTPTWYERRAARG